VGGVWQIRPRAAARAIAHVLDTLKQQGLVVVVAPSDSGKEKELVVINNHYATGEPFAVRRRQAEKESQRSRAARERQDTKGGGDEDGMEGLAEIEKERLRNMARNQELLRQLGLA
jgi:hypothetical protein